MKTKFLFLIFIALFSLSLISAQLIITPSTIDLDNVYPGNTYPINFTVAGIDNSQILNFNSNDKFVITPNQLIINNGDNVTIYLTLSKYLSSGDISVDLTSYINIEQVEVPSSSGSSCGGHHGGGIFYREKNNTIYVNKNTSCDNCNVTDNNIKSNNKESNSWLIEIILIVGFLIIYIVKKIILKIKNAQSKDENTELKGGNENNENNSEE